MTPSEAQKILLALAEGVDPETGQIVEGATPLSRPDVVRALFLAARALDANVQQLAQPKPVATVGKAGAAWTKEEDERLLRAFDGPFKMDFKHDSRSGRWYLLEINARSTLWHYLAAVNGVNLPAASYWHLVAQQPPPTTGYGTRYRWLAWRLDLKAYRALAQQHRLTFLQWIGSILRSRNVYSVFAWNDPGPWLFMERQRLRRQLRGGGRLILTALRQWRSSAS